jgi:hypothetical protein
MVISEQYINQFVLFRKDVNLGVNDDGLHTVSGSRAFFTGCTRPEMLLWRRELNLPLATHAQ